MTNRGTAKRTNMRWIEKDKSGKAMPEPVTPTLLEREAAHRAAHPNDKRSFNEPTATKVAKRQRRVLAPRPFLAKEKVEIQKNIKESDSKALMEVSRKRLLFIAHDRFRVLRQAAGVEAPYLPIDDLGEPIHYPNGGGKGKRGIVDWLLKYEDRYQDMNARLIMDEDIKQSLIDAHR